MSEIEEKRLEKKRLEKERLEKEKLEREQRNRSGNRVALRVVIVLLLLPAYLLLLAIDGVAEFFAALYGIESPLFVLYWGVIGMTWASFIFLVAGLLHRKPDRIGTRHYMPGLILSIIAGIPCPAFLPTMIGLYMLHYRPWLSESAEQRRERLEGEDHEDFLFAHPPS